MTGATSAEAARLAALFQAQGAKPVDADILLSADTLLDLYGEDIRGRAYLTTDPFGGEMVLRPDFTVPVVQMHMDSAADPARYTYAGRVFRKQEDDPSRQREATQVGFELFDGSDPATSDATVFAAIADALAGLPVRAATGDIGILMAAVAGLKTSDTRKAALMRHLWRPRKFRHLLDRFGGRTAPIASRAALLAQADPLADAAPIIGLRSKAEVQARIDALRLDAQTPPIGEGELALIDTLLGLDATCLHVLQSLRDIAVDLPAISAAVDAFSARLDALASQGVNVDQLAFEGSYGRTSLEYYDGFVFGFYASDAPHLPPIATGGRYDALTAQLGAGRAVPAVGGVVRPDLVVALRGDV